MLRLFLLTFALAVVADSPALADTDLFTITGPDATVIQFTASSSAQDEGGIGPAPSSGRDSPYVLSGSGSYDGTSGYTFYFSVTKTGLHDYEYTLPEGGIAPPYFSLNIPGSFLAETVTCVPDPYLTPPCLDRYSYTFVPGSYTGSVVADGLAPPIPPEDVPYLSGPWSLTIAAQDTAPTPEPSALVLFGSGLAAVGFARLRSARCRRD